MSLASNTSSQISVPSTIQGAVDILRQGLHFLSDISDEDYTYKAKPHVDSSIGEHFRHTLDLFHALILQENQQINYNTRRRGHDIETSRAIALEEIKYISDWLEQLNPTALTNPVTIETEVSLNNQVCQSMTSSLEREITFAALHANHHYAMMKVIATFLQVQVTNTFGFAPTTTSYLRGQ
ncbi:DinB family protein [Vibrio sp. T187]|uniref:DinB family protein n=1 Tax=Vibrio TaxID=662 RepID=UPI0010C9A43B|nr:MULTISPECIES: DinB family protein [Vibrio]MBW3697430.1 DinB family protein [Vibrio sp. T187]